MCREVQQRRRILDLHDLLVRPLCLPPHRTTLICASSRLKSFNTPGHTVYTIGQINTYPLGIQAVQVVTSQSSGKPHYLSTMLIDYHSTPRSTCLGLVVGHCSGAMAAYAVSGGEFASLVSGIIPLTAHLWTDVGHDHEHCPRLHSALRAHHAVRPSDGSFAGVPSLTQRRRWVFYYFVRLSTKLASQRQRCNLPIPCSFQTLVQGGLSGLILAWANELTGSDNESTSTILEFCTRARCLTRGPRTRVRRGQLQHVRIRGPSVAAHVRLRPGPLWQSLPDHMPPCAYPQTHLPPSRAATGVQG